MSKEEFKSYLHELTRENYHRYGTTFETEYSKYYYDAGTGKVFACNDNEYIILKNILEHSDFEKINETGISEEEQIQTFDQLTNLIETENLFRLPNYKKFQSQEQSYLSQVGKDMQQLIIELTEQCNLRCKYCIYSDTMDKFRGFDKNNMSWDIAKMAIDYFLDCGKEEVSITFYGGEPLLQFELMKQCIDYSIEVNQGKKKLNFGFTTNLTLLTKEMAMYFASLDFCSITVSLDGPEEIHDMNRVTKSGKGSFHNVIQRLELLIDCMGTDKAKKLININAVFTRPCTIEKLIKINDFFTSLSWFPQEIQVRMSYEDKDNINDSTDEELISFYNEDMKETDPVDYFKMKCIENKSEKNLVFAKDNINLLTIQKRLISNKPIPFLRQNGCCVPGSRRLYVTTQGKYKVCERIGKSPDIGDVSKGIDIELIRKFYINDYSESSLEECGNCWATHLCSICYVSFYDDNGIDKEKKRKLCYGQRNYTKNHLIMYHQIMEKNPEYLEKISKITLK